MREKIGQYFSVVSFIRILFAILDSLSFLIFDANQQPGIKLKSRNVVYSFWKRLSL